MTCILLIFSPPPNPRTTGPPTRLAGQKATGRDTWLPINQITGTHSQTTRPPSVTDRCTLVATPERHDYKTGMTMVRHFSRRMQSTVAVTYVTYVVPDRVYVVQQLHVTDTPGRTSEQQWCESLA